jgi:DNA-binding PadR family transcriptional regulator
MPRFRDQSLIPSEATRFAALGELALASRSMAELSMAVRRFTSRMLGPSLDILGTSIEALRHEGLIEPVGPRAGPSQSLKADSVLALTEAGRAALGEYLRSRVRTPMTDLSRLVVALKLRFLDALDAADRRAQLEQLVELCEGELARLADLRQSYADGAFADWLALEIAETRARLAWYRQRAESP